MNNEFENNSEIQFEEMRRQMNTLKKKLERQEIINDQIIRRSLKGSTSSINRRYMLTCFLSLFMIPYGYWAFVVLNGSSIGVWIFLSILMLIVFGYTVYNGRHLRDTDLYNSDLLGARQKIAKAKKLDSDWLMFGIPAVIIWLGYFFFDIYSKMQHDYFEYFAILIFVCAVIGGAIGMKVHLRNQKNYQDIIDQIEDLARE